MNPEPNPSAPAPAGAAPPTPGPAGPAPAMPAAGPAPAMPASSGAKFGVTVADLIVAGGAVFILLFSWAPVVDGKYGHITFRGDLSGVSLWSWLRPLGLFVILAALLLIATAAVDTWWHRDKPMVGVHRHHVQVALALFCLVTIFGMGLADPYGGVITIGWGAFPQLLGALAASAGAVLNHFNLLQNKLTVPESKPAAYPPPGAYPAGYPAPGQPVYGQPVPGQPAPGQPIYGQPVPGQPAPPAAEQSTPPAAGNVPPVPGNVPPAEPTAADPNSLI